MNLKLKNSIDKEKRKRREKKGRRINKRKFSPRYPGT